MAKLLKQLGHLAKDCSKNTASGSSSKKVSPSTSSKGEDVVKVEKRLRKDEETSSVLHL